MNGSSSSEKRYDSEKVYASETVCPSSISNERPSTPDISEFLHPEEFERKMNLDQNGYKDSSKSISGESPLINRSISVSTDSSINHSTVQRNSKVSSSSNEDNLFKYTSKDSSAKISEETSLISRNTSVPISSFISSTNLQHISKTSSSLSEDNVFKQEYKGKDSSKRTSEEASLISRSTSVPAGSSINSSSPQRNSKISSSSSEDRRSTSNDDSPLRSVIHSVNFPEENLKKADVFSSKSSNLGKSSSSTNSVTVSRNRLITPNVPNYSGDQGSSHTKSSTTPQASTSFKVVAVVEGRGVARGEIGMAYIDLKHPLLVLSQFSDTQAYIRLAVQLNILQPIEIILPHTVVESRSKIISRIQEMFPELSTVTVMRKQFNETKGLQYIRDLCVPEYKTVEVEVASKYYSLAACAALIKYMEFKQNMSYAFHSLKIVYRTSADTTMISTSSARNLELVTNELGKIEHTLYGILNHTQTPGGDRLLRANILQPPSDVNTIITRQDCIAELMDNEDLFNDLRSVIGKFMDTEHMLSLCIQIHKEKNVRNSEQKIMNVIALKHSLDLVKPLHDFLANAKNALFQTYYQALSDERFQDLQTKIGLVIHNDTRMQKGMLNMHMQKCFAVKSNINGLLDIARRAYSESVNDVADIVKQLEKQYDLPLKVEYNTVKGFYIQIPQKAVPHIAKLPSIFLKVNVFKSHITCTTEDLIKLNDRIRESLNEIYIMSDIIIDEVLVEVRENIACLYYLTEAVSSIDFLLSLTYACTLSDHVRPEFSGITAVKGGRHPVIEKIIGTTFVPNDTFLCEDMNFVVLSGANMSGKTTYLKQVAVLQIMAQIGCYVPAEYASFRIAEKILTRMGNSSDIEKNYSTFMLQMKEANFILQHSTENSLILMDELGNGTSLEEGCGIAYAICEELLKTKAFSIFSTHFMEITELEKVYPNVDNYHFRVDYKLNDGEGCIWNFAHVLKPGPCKEKYYGTKIAALSTLPKPVIKEALKIIQSRSENKKTEHGSYLIDKKMKRKIQTAIHLTHVIKYVALDENELRDHLRLLKAECGEDDSSEHSQSISSNT